MNNETDNPNRPPRPCIPSVVPGVGWSPRLQISMFSWLFARLVSLTTTAQRILPANPDRLAIMLEYVSGSRSIRLAVGDIPTLGAADVATAWNDPRPIIIHSTDYPALPSYDWSATSSDDSTNVWKVWELVSNY